ncbi:TPA: hypothetical protein U1335_000073 [Streptococcus suis]|nr:hypothetical protein [Streptococcus suis]
MPASGAVDGGLCAVGAGGEVERGVGRYSSAIYGKEKGMEKLAAIGIVLLVVFAFNAPLFYYLLEDFGESDEERECDECGN